MEKIFIKPIAKEILIKGNGKEGSSDSFLYDSDSDSARRGLGNLYVVGNVQTTETGEDLDVAYIINLVASLAKREYYANPDLAPKEAFTAALKKINGVVEEFFKKKGTQINIGIFAIADQQLHISKLGKFKILLARDGETIDILNNVNLFSKESTQEKEFSSIISGKVSEGDRVLAFYPSRTVTARTKVIKDNFMKLPQDGFVATLQSIKESKPDFMCSAVHIEVQKSTEVAVNPRVQPKELQEPEIDELEASAPIHATLASEDTTPPPVPVKIKKGPVMPRIIETPIDSATIPKEEVAAPAPKAQQAQPVSYKAEIPKIIPSEFALGRRISPAMKYIRRFRLGNLNINPRNKAVVFTSAAVVVIAAIIIVKTLFIVSPTDRALSSVISEIKNNISQADAKANQNDLSGARSLLVGSLATLAQSDQTNGTSSKTDAARKEVEQKLDTIEGAVDASLSMVATIPTDSGQAELVQANTTGLYAYIQAGDTGAIAKVSANGIDSTATVTGLSPSALFGSDTYIATLDSNAKKIASLNLSKSTIGVTTFGGDSIINAEIYQNNLYAITAAGIIKIADAALGHTDITSWLANGTTLATNPALIAVDGNIYVISQSGVLTTYYKGKKTNETNIPITVDAGTLLLTTTDSQNLYLVNKSLGRIYIIKKDTGSLIKTLKLNTDKAISSATIDSAEVLYILSDNKVWKVQN